MLYTYRVFRFFYVKVACVVSSLFTRLLFYIHGVEMENNFQTNGILRLYMHNTARFKIGNNLKLNNTIRSNPIGRSEKCIFVIREHANIIIGNNVGMSGVVLVAHKEIIIKDNVKIGGNVCIYDTDFHALNSIDREIPTNDKKNTKQSTVIIEENVFIGAHSTILKGVKIGKNSIIGACSVVTKDVPENEIWAGNPAKLIKKIDEI